MTEYFTNYVYNLMLLYLILADSCVCFYWHGSVHCDHWPLALGARRAWCFDLALSRRGAHLWRAHQRNGSSLNACSLRVVSTYIFNRCIYLFQASIWLNTSLIISCIYCAARLAKAVLHRLRRERAERCGCDRALSIVSVVHLRPCFPRARVWADDGDDVYHTTPFVYVDLRCVHYLF